MSTTPSQLEKELAVSIIAAREAGKIILAHRDNPPGARRKDNGSWITDVDTMASEAIGETLGLQFGDYGRLDEEQEEDGSRFESDYCWFIDPLDSTGDYVRKDDGYGVIIGLTYQFKPVLGVTYKPQFDELVYAMKGKGAYRVSEGGEAEKIEVSPDEEVHILLSQYRNNDELSRMIAAIDPLQTRRMGGSLKIVEIAKGAKGLGNLFICPPSRRIHLWDVCGPQVILEEAGGKLTGVYGTDVNYQQGDAEIGGGVMATNGVIHEKVIDWISD